MYTNIDFIIKKVGVDEWLAMMELGNGMKALAWQPNKNIAYRWTDNVQVGIECRSLHAFAIVELVEKKSC